MMFEMTLEMVGLSWLVGNIAMFAMFTGYLLEIDKHNKKEN